MKQITLTTTQWVIIALLILIPFGIPIVIGSAALISTIIFLITYLLAIISYLTIATIIFSLVRFYTRYAVRVAFMAYIVIWTFIGYGVFENNPFLIIFGLWKEFIIWGFMKLNLNSIIPYSAIIQGVKKQWYEANVFDLDSRRDLVWLFLIIWPIVFTVQS